MAPGAHVRVHTSSAYLSGRVWSGSDVAMGTALFVTSVEPDWFEATVRITAVNIPADADE
jgi:hypothetical protein